MSLRLCVVVIGGWVQANNWWERSPNTSNSTNFMNVNINGNPNNNNNANNTNAAALGFPILQVRMNKPEELIIEKETMTFHIMWQIYRCLLQ